MFAGLLLSTYVPFITSDLHLVKTWLQQWLSRWYTHANSVIRGQTDVKRLQSVQSSVARQLQPVFSSTLAYITLVTYSLHD